MSATTTSGEPCVECDPEVFRHDRRPKMFLPLCKAHLAAVVPISDEQIGTAIKEGTRQRDAVAAGEPQFVPPRGFFR